MLLSYNSQRGQTTNVLFFFFSFFTRNVNSVTFLFYYPMVTPELILLEQEIYIPELIRH